MALAIVAKNTLGQLREVDAQRDAAPCECEATDQHHPEGRLLSNVTPLLLTARFLGETLGLCRLSG